MFSGIEFPFTQRELKRMGIWLNMSDIRVSVTEFVDCKTYDFVYTPKVQVRMTVHPDDDVDMRKDMMEECLLAIQECIGKNVVKRMLDRGTDREAYMYPTRIHVRGDKRWLNLNPKFFPSFHLKNNDILVLTSSEVYHRIIRSVLAGENPDALVGKIEWIDAPRFTR